MWMIEREAWGMGCHGGWDDLRLISSKVGDIL
jgi:hypothetical protein